MTACKTNTRRIPLCLVVGFLGSGKTTLLRHIAHTHRDKKLGFLVNEFSSLDADGATLKREHDKVICLPGGSVFCRCLAGQFIQILKDLPLLLDLPECDGVVVEASGIADPGVAPQMMRDASLDVYYKMTRIIAVVDPGNILHLLDQLPNSKSQIQAADTIIINKTDVYDISVVNDAEDRLQRINNKAEIIKTSHCQTEVPLFEGVSAAVPSGDYAPCADPNFATVAIDAEQPVDVERFIRALATLQETLYRAKGFLRAEAGATYLDWTPSTCSRFELPDHAGPFGFTLIGAGNKAPAINALAARLRAGAFSMNG